MSSIAGWSKDQNTEPSDSISPWMSGSTYEPGKMKIAYFSNEFPHDDLKDLLRRLHVSSKNLSFTILAKFIREATLSIRDEVRSLPADLRDTIPPFETILNFADFTALRNGPLGGSIDGVLLCTIQIATLIGHHENDTNEPFDFHSVDACLAGLGTGLLATTSIALSPTLADVAVVGAEVVRIAFRLGVLVDEVSLNLQPRQLLVEGSTPDSWAYVMPNVTVDEVQKELDTVQETQSIPAASKIFISAISRTSVTISGPPARLKHIFLVSDYFRDHKSVALPVYAGLCHAKHVYNKEHVDSIVGISSLESLDARYSPRVPVYSTSTGKPFAAKSAKLLFGEIIEEILTQSIKWDNVIEGIVRNVKSNDSSECKVLTFRNSLPARDLMDALDVELPPPNKSTAVDFLSWVATAEKAKQNPRGTAQSKLAIVGMACRLPNGATDTEKFWEILDQGLDVHRRIPADRFDVDSHYDPTGKRMNTSITPYGCFIDEPGLFDAPFFNMSPSEALQTDPMQRFALVTAYEALERAGYVENRTSSTNLHRIGTFYGQASDDYREVNSNQEVGTYFITGGCRAFGPGRINYFFKFSGPSYSIDTACSSSLATIQTACTALWNGDVDMAVAGGMNVLSNSDAFAGLSKGHFLSKTPNACKTWDAEADGYCRADAVGSVVIKRLEDAEADNDNILGVIVGAGTNHSAEAVSITHPHAGHQAYLTSQLLNQAGIDPLDVSFVEMHGTGTQAGDREEIESVTNVFAPLTKRRSPKQPLHIGAVKSNVGHSEAAAGITALLKVLLMLDKGYIPKHVGIKQQLSPKFPKDLDKRNVHIPYEKTPWHRVAGKPRIAVVNNFSAAGGNSSVVVEEAPLRSAIEWVDPRSAHVVSVSAKSKISLKANLERMITYLDQNPDVSIPDLAYTTTARRYHHHHRVAISTSNVEHLKKQLNSTIQSVESRKPIPANGAPSVVFTFTGQGSSHRSMNLELFRDSQYFRTQLLHLDAISQGQGFPSFIPVIDGSHAEDFTHPPTMTHLALVCTEIALAKYWGSLGVRPDVVVGHSLGEFAALHVAGVLSASDAIFLAGQRAVMLEKKCKIGSHKMVAAKASLAEVQEVMGDFPFEVACINGPKDTVLSGPLEQMEKATELLQGAGYKLFSLDVAFAFHSTQTDPILDDYEEIARKGVLFQPPTMPIISPLLGKVVFDEKTINANYMRRATRETVDFLSALQTAQKMSTVDETMVWVEIGPHPVCVGFARSILPSVNAAVPSLRRGEDNWQTISNSLSALHSTGIEVKWNEYHRSFEHGLRLLDLPTYAWNDKNYWIQYNGDWNLTKGNTFYDAEKAAKAPKTLANSNIRTSLVQRIVDEEFSLSSGRVVMQSDLMQADFLAAAWGHKMNGVGVVTSSIHADIAYTLGVYLMEKLRPKVKVVDMNVSDLVVHKGLIANVNTSIAQPIQVSAVLDDIETGLVHLEWANVFPNGDIEEPFANAVLRYESANDWLTSWVPMTHLVQGRIETLERLANQGVANRFSHNMAYLLFANNLVDYANKYRGMQSVVIHELEAFADITISKEKGGIWTIPPFFIDSVCHLAGFVMNVSDAIDTKNNYCVTPGWGSMRFAKPLVAGGNYRSYVKMIPTAEDPSIFLGDVYIIQDSVIIGMVGAIKFRRYPRLLLNRFFSAPDQGNTSVDVSKKVTSAVVSKNIIQATPASKPAPVSKPAIISTPQAAPVVSTPAAPVVAPEAPPQVDVDSNSTAAKAMALVAAEAALELSDLVDDASFANLGVDSLMSLVISEKFRENLGVTVSGSLFLEYPTVGDLRAWLVEYYS